MSGTMSDDTRPPRRLRRSALAIAVFIAMTPAGPAGADGSGQAKAITGDTIELAGTRYCLAGIDAPEPGQTCTLDTGKSYDCGRIATTALMDLLAGATVQCKSTGARRNGCLVAQCAADGFDLSANMVHTGWALADPASPARYTAVQAKAKQSRHGLWRGTFMPPWKWRQHADRPPK